MADDKDGRDKQARDEQRRQRKREIRTELKRGDEAEPPVDVAELAYFEAALEPIEFPATGADVLAVVGDQSVEAVDGTYRVAELVPDAGVERFESPDEVRVRIQRPTVAAAMKRVVEAIEGVPDAELKRSQRDAYERTFEELRERDAVDEDEGVPVIADWIVERIREKGRVPGSRDVRREAAKYCRSNGYEIRNDEWLGV